MGGHWPKTIGNPWCTCYSVSTMLACSCTHVYIHVPVLRVTNYLFNCLLTLHVATKTLHNAHPQTHTNLHTLTDRQSSNCPMIPPSQAWPVCSETAVQWASVGVTFDCTICQPPWPQTHWSHSLRLPPAFHKPISSGALSPTANNELWERHTHTYTMSCFNIEWTVHSAGLHGRWLRLLYKGMTGCRGINQDSSNHWHLGSHLKHHYILFLILTSH